MKQIDISFNQFVEHKSGFILFQACSVSSAALVSSLHLTKDSFDVVKRWTNEVQESCSSDNIMVQVCSNDVIYPQNYLHGAFAKTVNLWGENFLFQLITIKLPKNLNQVIV